MTVSKQTQENLLLFGALAAFWWFVLSKANAAPAPSSSKLPTVSDDSGSDFGASASDSW